ncbi:hypothetical protein ACFL6P_07105 [Candidatus Latescibacterota bacterium]
MTINEYEKRLGELSHEEFQKFKIDFGGSKETIEKRVREFVDHPEYERRICQLLGLQTEEEKLNDAAVKSADATVKSANAAVQSAVSANRSMIWSGIACIAAIAAVIVTIIGLFVND